ncbi:hypothetical protein [Planctomicrobium sp. SH527]|uniref:hypothetical protein n=1 Tax=Planctomicrobium sp. SH527 TaxID=3448123 RepID=UPI003F5B6C2C
MPPGIATLFKVNLSGGVVWHSRKTGYPFNPLVKTQPSTALITSPNGWVADCGGWITDTETSAQFSVVDDLGGSFDLVSDSDLASMYSGRPLAYEHWLRSVNTTTGEEWIWGIPLGKDTRPAWNALPVAPHDNIYWYRFDPASGECVQARTVNGSAGGNPSSGPYVLDSWVAVSGFTTRRTACQNSYGGFAHLLRRDRLPTAPTEGHINHRTSHIYSYRPGISALGAKEIRYPYPNDVPIVAHNDHEIAFCKLGSSNGSGFGNYTSVEIIDTAVTAGTGSSLQTRASKNLVNVASTDHLAYRADTIDSNGTNIATRIRPIQTAYLLDNDLNVLFSVTDSDPDHWITNHLIVAGESQLYQFILDDSQWFATCYNSSGLKWKTAISPSGVSSLPRVYEAREHGGVLYLSGRLPDVSDSTKDVNLMAIDGDTGSILWAKQLVTPLPESIGGAEFEIVDDHIFLTCCGTVQAGIVV